KFGLRILLAVHGSCTCEKHKYNRGCFHRFVDFPVYRLMYCRQQPLSIEQKLRALLRHFLVTHFTGPSNRGVMRKQINPICPSRTAVVYLLQSELTLFWYGLGTSFENQLLSV